MRNDLSAEHLAQEVTLTLPLSAVLRLTNGEDKAAPLALRAAFHKDTGPVIGEAYQDGLFAGLTLHEGEPSELVLLPGDQGDLDWQGARDWAAKQDGVLPSRIDQLVLLQNLKAEFKDAYYWSGEQSADDERWAWCQYFGHGNQITLSKDNQLRARAVRRVPL